MSLLDRSDIALLIFLGFLSTFFISLGISVFYGIQYAQEVAIGALIVLGLFFSVVIIVTIADAYKYWKLEQSYSSDNV